ncbi:MAG: helix-turn-helix transcriptional regulator [Planctomycetes bacterium]|nr:helix-turn-helix transcriptional regulator [Planctomycetota bacterium]
MDELIVRVMRTAACATRLRVLSCLAGVEELPPSIARELRIAPGLLAVHLARLAAAGLVERRRSGTRCYCSARSLSHRIASARRWVAPSSVLA